MGDILPRRRDGNVYEWCHDRFKDDLGPQRAVDPLTLDGLVQRVVRGGGHKDYFRPHNLRAAFPGQRFNHQGLRCARTLDGFK